MLYNIRLTKNGAILFSLLSLSISHAVIAVILLLGLLLSSILHLLLILLVILTNLLLLHLVYGRIVPLLALEVVHWAGSLLSLLLRNRRHKLVWKGGQCAYFIQIWVNRGNIWRHHKVRLVKVIATMILGHSCKLSLIHLVETTAQGLSLLSHLLVLCGIYAASRRNRARPSWPKTCISGRKTLICHHLRAHESILVLVPIVVRILACHLLFFLIICQPNGLFCSLGSLLPNFHVESLVAILRVTSVTRVIRVRLNLVLPRILVLNHQRSHRLTFIVESTGRSNREIGLLVRLEGLILLGICRNLLLLLFKEDSVVLGVRNWTLSSSVVVVVFLPNQLLLDLASLFFGHKLLRHAVRISHLGAAFEVQILGGRHLTIWIHVRFTSIVRFPIIVETPFWRVDSCVHKGTSVSRVSLFVIAFLAHGSLAASLVVRFIFWLHNEVEVVILGHIVVSHAPVIFNLILPGRLRIQFDSSFARNVTLVLRLGFHPLARSPYFFLNRVQFLLLFLLLQETLPFQSRCFWAG